MIITNRSCLRDTQPTTNTELHRHERHNKWFKFLEWQLLMNPSAAKARKTIALSLILVVSLIGNSLFGIIIYKTPNLRKPINFLIANMALSDVLYPIFFFPSRPTLLHLDGWLIGGPLGQALPKLPSFLADTCTLVSVQSLILITVDRFQATVVQLRSPLISLETWMAFIRHILLLSNSLNTQRA